MKIKEELQKLKLIPRKSLGQNFLKNSTIAQTIITKLALKPQTHVIEIGPGLGILTKELLPIAKHLLVLEKDPLLVSYLMAKFRNHSKITIKEQDALTYNWSKISHQDKVVVVGNLPYNIATAILQKLLIHHHQISELFLSFPEAVGAKILANPKDPLYGYLSIFVKLLSIPKLMTTISKEWFFPEPKITSVFIRFQLKTQWDIPDHDFLPLTQFIKQCFANRRKTLINNLKRIQKNNLDVITKVENFFQNHQWKLTLRPEELAVEEWIKFFQFWQKII